MPRSASRLEQEDQVLNCIKDEAKNITQIANEVSMNYYTVRNLVNALLKEDSIKLVGVENGHRIYKYDVTSKRATETIPRIVNIISKESAKVIDLIGAVGNESETRAARASINIIRHVVSLMNCAILTDHSMEVGFRLERIRNEMQQDYLHVKNLASVYEQILQDERFWNPKRLKKMREDPEFNALSIQKSYDYYFEAGHKA